jgi:DNA-binding beta-propeller fold protein YncE
VSDTNRVNASREIQPAPGFTEIAEIATEGGAVSGIAVSADGALLAIAHHGDDCFSLIDTANYAVLQTVIDVDEPFAIAMSEKAAGRAYVSSAVASYDSILAFDTDANRVVATYPLAFSVTDLAVSPDGRHVYASRAGSDGADLAVVDTWTGDDDAISIATAVGATAECVRVSADGRRLYVASNSASTAELVIIDAQQRRVLNTVEIGSPIRDIALSADGAAAYVGSCAPDFGTVVDVVDVRDVRTATVTNTYKFGDMVGLLTRLTISRDGERAYLVGDQGMAALSTATQDVIGGIAINGRPACAIESPDGNRLYIADYTGMVTVLATASATAPVTAEDEPTVANQWALSDLLVLEPTLA